MKFQYLFVLSNVALIITVVKAESSEEIKPKELSSKLLKEAVKFLGKRFAENALICLEEAAEHCKNDMKHLEKLAKCAGQFLKENEGRCLI